MHVYPENKADILKTYTEGTAQVLWTKLVADLETPVSAMLKLADGLANSFLLESVEKGDIRGRYSIIGLKPDIIWRAHKGQAEINRHARTDDKTFIDDGEAFASLRRLIAESRIELPEELPPMAAGLVGYMGYDMVRLVEKLPDTNPDPLDIHDSIFMRPTVMAIFDTIEDIVTLVTPLRPVAGIDADAAYHLAAERLADIVAQFNRNLPHKRAISGHANPPPTPEPNMSQDEFHAMVEKGKEYIKAGDIFQVVLSQRFTIPFKLPPLALYRSLRRTNPSPFLFYLDLGGHALVGSSPEILVRLRDGEVTIRPIAGTRPRGATPQEDKALAEDLLHDPKELAEHLMLLDLGRNDVGRVSEIGSVQLTDRMIIENYSHVMHIVSNVIGKARSTCDAMDTLMAGFPAGTVSGAPKVRAMEIIDELEPVRRSFYAGAVGYISANGNMDTCITLRTALVKDGNMYVQAGGGVVYDSSPEGEYQESWNKARALIRAAEEAVRFASES
jgi:anthranilate synthase component 1